jgi:hypothetical protein
MAVFFLSVAFIAIAMLAMAVGVIFSNRCLRGSCGGPEVLGPDGKPLTCPTCSNKQKHSVEQPYTSAE